MAERIRLVPNEPLTVKLLDPFADSSERYDPELRICEYRTTDGRILALPKAAAIILNDLNPQPGEEIGVCRYTGKQARIAVWLAASSELARAEAETALESSEGQTDTELLLEASLKRETARKRRNGTPTPIRLPTLKTAKGAYELVMGIPPLPGTGTDGPAPLRVPQPAAAKSRVKYGEALRHIIHTVESTLKAEGVQLGDGPKQDLYSTLYIDFAKRSGVEYDFTTEGQ